MDYDLNRFLAAQEKKYNVALEEIKHGFKCSHWMWFIFPQHKDLGMTTTSKFYGIKNLTEAKQYLNHPVLGKRLREISAELLRHKEKSAEDIFGYLDALKLRSCMTLFDLAEPDAVFGEVLRTFYDGQKDVITLKLLNLHD